MLSRELVSEPPRAREEALPRVGDAVEIRTLERGFENAWFQARVLKVSGLDANHQVLCA